MNKKIAVIVGSLRKESLNRKMAHALMALSPSSLNLEIIEIGDLPLYNQDLDDEGNVPAAWTHFREQMKTCQGVLFITPEYNRSVPGVLKNALDVGSRPYGQSIWSKKSGAVISISPGAIGGFGANQHLRQSFVFLDIPALQQEAYIGQAGTLFDDQGNIANEDTKKFMHQLMERYADWVELTSGK
ncbi:MAG: NAD(P)H-dependent oxidoreductase [Legionella sp.]|nr:NAD(P)H-dependent oxidoreductase [Legionella sp.]